MKRRKNVRRINENKELVTNFEQNLFENLYHFARMGEYYYHSDFLYSEFSWKYPNTDYYLAMNVDPDRLIETLVVEQEDDYLWGDWDNYEYFEFNNEKIMKPQSYETPYFYVPSSSEVFSKSFYKENSKIFKETLDNLEKYMKKYKINIRTKHDSVVSSDILKKEFEELGYNDVYEGAVNEVNNIFTENPKLVFYKEKGFSRTDVDYYSNYFVYKESLLTLCVYWECMVNRLYELHEMDKSPVLAYADIAEDLYDEWYYLVNDAIDKYGDMYDEDDDF